MTRTEDPFQPKTHFVDFGRPLLTMASLAIHMNREVNDGYKWNKQKDILPLAALIGEDEKESAFFEKFLAKELGCCEKDILSFDLSAYPTEDGCTFGLHDDFVSSPRLDNLTSCKACLEGIVNGKAEEGVALIGLFDNEEVGSTTKQGANSLVLHNTLHRIYKTLDLTEEALFEDMAKGFITNRPVLGRGLALKQACSQSYAGDAEAVAVIKGLCDRKNIPYQLYVNRSDIKGGSTLGSMASAITPIRTMDLGVALLAMHSARETMGASDQKALEDLVTEFFA